MINKTQKKSKRNVEVIGNVDTEEIVSILTKRAQECHLPRSSSTLRSHILKLPHKQCLKSAITFWVNGKSSGV